MPISPKVPESSKLQLLTHAELSLFKNVVEEHWVQYLSLVQTSQLTITYEHNSQILLLKFS